MKVGRPTDYNQKIVDKICELLSQGKSLKKICEADEMPDISTVFKWLGKFPEFVDKYDIAKQNGLEARELELAELGQEAIEMAQKVDSRSSNAVVAAYKLKADNMKWAMSKLKPKKYGDKVDLTTDGKELPTPILTVINPK